jgi:hypothetical protein
MWNYGENNICSPNYARVPANREKFRFGILLSGDYSGIGDRGDIEVDPYKETES